MQSIYEKILENLNEEGALEVNFSIRDIEYSQDPFIFDGAYDVFQYLHEDMSKVNSKNELEYKKIFSDLRENKADIVKNILKISYLLHEDGTIKILNFTMRNLKKVRVASFYELIKQEFLQIIRKSKDIELIKFALMMLRDDANYLNVEERKLIKTLALCDEFTLYASIVIDQWPRAREEFFELAKLLNGWGRIIVLPKLDLLDKAVSEWLLAEGWKNFAKPEYQANLILSYSSVLDLISERELKFVEYMNFSEIIFNAIKIEPGVVRLMDIQVRMQIKILRLWLREFKRHELNAFSIILFLILFKTYEHVFLYMKEHNSQRVIKASIYQNEKIFLHPFMRYFEVYDELKILLHEMQELYDLELFKDQMENSKPEIKYYFFAILGRITVDYEFKDALEENPFAYIELLTLLFIQQNPYSELFLDYFAEYLPLVEIAEGPNTKRDCWELSRDEEILCKIISKIRYKVGLGREFLISALQSSHPSLRLSALMSLDIWLKISRKKLSEIDMELAKLIHVIIQFEDNFEALRKELDLLERI